MSYNYNNKTLKKIMTYSFFGAIVLFSMTASAASGDNMNIGNVASTITSSFQKLAQLMTAASYIAGIGFALSAILKFKQHKDNPQQVQIGQPIALIFISAALLFLPTILGIAGQSVFGSAKESGGYTGTAPTWGS